MQILSLDPSSTALGVCIAEFSKGFRVLGSRSFRPPQSRTVEERVDLIVGTAQRDLIRDYDAVLIEFPSGKVGSRHKGGGAGLSIYGVAVGAVRQAMIEKIGKERVFCIRENEWTGGGRKSKRGIEARAVYSGYDKRTDPGSDEADAILMAHWAWRTGYLKHFDFERSAA